MTNETPDILVPFLGPLRALWEPADDLPPSEIAMGTVGFVLVNYLGPGFGEVFLDDLQKYNVFLLPPIDECSATTPRNFISQASLTHLFFSAHHWRREHSHLWHKHIQDSWILTIRKTGRRTSDDVAFLLFHLHQEKNDLATVEFVCVANGIDGTPSCTPERKSFAGCHLDLFLYNVLATVLLSSLPEGDPCSIITLRSPDDDNAASLPRTFTPILEEGDVPASLLHKFWVDKKAEHFLWRTLARNSVEEEKEGGCLDYVPVTSDSTPQMEVENSDEESSTTPSYDEGSADLLRKHVNSIFKSHDPNSYLEEETQEPVEVSDSDFEKCKCLYEETIKFPEAPFLVDNQRDDVSLSQTYDEALSLKFDIDSCLVHAATPSETASALEGAFMTISHPHCYKRNKASNRLLVKTVYTSQSGKAVGKDSDMAKFPNFEIAKLWVSEHSTDFTMNLHIINEQPPPSNMVDEPELYAWNASLNRARNCFKESPAFHRWLNDDDKKIHAVSLGYKLASTNSFEVRISGTKSKKNHTPVRFNYQAGCLFLEIVWEYLIAIARKEVEPECTEIRYPEVYGSSKLRLSSLQEAAENLWRKSHTVAQAAGFRHDFPDVVPVGRPHFWSQKELHRWINQEHQKITKSARRKLFRDGAIPSVFASVDIGINFLSNNPNLLFLINGFKAQAIVRKTTKITVLESQSYYDALEHTDEQDVETEMSDNDPVPPFDPNPFLGKKTAKVRNLGDVACTFAFCI